MGGMEAIVINRLLRWAKWKLNSGVALGYGKHVSFIGLAGGGNETWDVAVDHECIQTNQAVEQLPELHKAIIRTEYIQVSRSESHKAEMFGCCVRSFRQWRHDAHKKIANNLNLRLTMVPKYVHNKVNSSSCL